MSAEVFDVAVVGSGAAGGGAAYTLSRAGLKVLLLDASRIPPEHSSARTAALFSKSYASSASVSALVNASETFFRTPPPEFANAELLIDRDTLHVFNERNAGDGIQLYKEMQAFPAKDNISMIYKQEIMERATYLRPEYPFIAIWECGSGDLDPMALVLGYRTGTRKCGGVIVNDAEVIAGEYRHGLWEITTRAGHYRARNLINASGAWGDIVAKRCGIAPLGLRPLLRTAMDIRVQGDEVGRDLPFVFLPSDNFYCRVSGSIVRMSPADEVPSEACDAQPDDEDVARTIEKLMSVTTLVPEARKPKAWAGLRTFAPDRNPVVGPDLDNPNFFWLVGQGGYGIETAPAISELVVALMTKDTVPPKLAALGFRLEEVLPSRLRATTAA